MDPRLTQCGSAGMTAPAFAGVVFGPAGGPMRTRGDDKLLWSLSKKIKPLIMPEARPFR